MRHLQLRRSNNVYNTIDEAKAALTGQSANLLDGEPIVVSYKDATATESNGVAQIIGFKIKKNNVDTIYTLNLQDIIKKSGRGTAIKEVKRLVDADGQYSKTAEDTHPTSGDTISSDKYVITKETVKPNGQVETTQDALKLMYTNVSPVNLRVPETIGDIEAGTTAGSLNNYTLSEIIDKLIFKTIYPTVTEPTATIATNKYSNGTSIKIGSEALADSNLSVTLNQGNVHVEDRVTADIRYVGAKTSETHTNNNGAMTTGTKVDRANNKTVYATLGAFVYKGTANYAAGATIRTSKGDSPNPIKTTNGGNVANPHPAGSIETSNNITINVTAPVSANTGTTYSTNLVELPLQAWTQAWTYQVQFPNTDNAHPLVIKTPKKLTSANAFNTISGRYDVNKLSGFGNPVESDETIFTDSTGNAVKVKYYTYTWNGGALASVKFELKMN
jgi:hypothetical protein